jgi:hypothetical protein
MYINLKTNTIGYMAFYGVNTDKLQFTTCNIQTHLGYLRLGTIGLSYIPHNIANLIVL